MFDDRMVSTATQVDIPGTFLVHLCFFKYSHMRLQALNATLRVIKHGWLENGPLISDFPINTSIQFEDCPASHVADYQRVNH